MEHIHYIHSIKQLQQNSRQWHFPWKLCLCILRSFSRARAFGQKCVRVYLCNTYTRSVIVHDWTLSESCSFENFNAHAHTFFCIDFSSYRMEKRRRQKRYKYLTREDRDLPSFVMDARRHSQVLRDLFMERVSHVWITFFSLFLFSSSLDEYMLL